MPKYIRQNFDGTLSETTNRNDHRICEIRLSVKEHREYVRKCNALINQANALTQKTKDDLQTQIDLNSNLLRIARERANANRGITPKKEHNGYLVLSSRQWSERYEHELTSAEYAEMPISFRRNHLYPCTTSKAATTWKSILQTPYDASLPLSCIQSKIEDTDLWDNDILDALGCPQMNSSELNGSYGIFEDNDGNECNGLYRWVYIANYRTGFWEMELYTTQSLTVPLSYRPVSC